MFCARRRTSSQVERRKVMVAPMPNQFSLTGAESSLFEMFHISAQNLEVRAYEMAEAMMIGSEVRNTATNSC